MKVIALQKDKADTRRTRAAKTTKAPAKTKK
jgi:hypothetical protein